MLTAAVLAVASGAGARGAPAQGAPATRPSAETMRPVLDGLYDAVGRADTAALRPRLAAELVWTDGVTGADVSRDRLLAVLGARGPGAAARTERDSLDVRAVGGVAFVGYRRTDRRAVGGVELPTRWRVTDAFLWRDGRWQLVRHSRTWLVAPVAAAAGVDSAALQAFVGRYEVAPGYVDDVHWEGGHLVATLTGGGAAPRAGARLVPVSATVFSPDGTGALIAFERDAAGRVTGYVQGYPDGRVNRRRKLP
jgi:hypothetical protein